MPTIRFILHMNDGRVIVVYHKFQVELLDGQYKSVTTQVMTEYGWKDVPD